MVISDIGFWFVVNTDINLQYYLWDIINIISIVLSLTNVTRNTALYQTQIH